MKRRFLAVTTGCLLLGGGVGCDADTLADAGCTARVEYQGVTYRGHNQVHQSPRTEARAAGSGEVIDCDGEPVDEVAVHDIRGVAPGIAIAVLDPDWRGIYVVAGTSPDVWPPSGDG